MTSALKKPQDAWSKYKDTKQGTKEKNSVKTDYFPIAEEGRDGYIHFPKTWAQIETQTDSSLTCKRVLLFISSSDNSYTEWTSIK